MYVIEKRNLLTDLQKKGSLSDCINYRDTIKSARAKSRLN